MSAADLEWVYLVRHGQTAWNTQRRRQGQLDSPLTPDGLLHAETTANLMTAMNADRVFSSLLGRARTTAAVIASTLALPIDVIDDLREVHHGRIAGLTDAQIERDHAQVRHPSTGSNTSSTGRPGAASSSARGRSSEGW